jgi:hypothetical protein
VHIVDVITGKVSHSALRPVSVGGSTSQFPRRETCLSQCIVLLHSFIDFFGFRGSHPSLLPPRRTHPTQADGAGHGCSAVRASLVAPALAAQRPHEQSHTQEHPGGAGQLPPLRPQRHPLPHPARRSPRARRSSRPVAGGARRSGARGRARGRLPLMRPAPATPSSPAAASSPSRDAIP